MQKRPLSLPYFFILAIIFFGYFIFSSLSSHFLASDINSVQTITASSFNDTQNYGSIIIELVLLSIAFLLLKWQKFDFSLLNFKVNLYTIPLTILIVLIGGMSTDFILYGSQFLYTGQNPFDFDGHISFGHITIGLLLFSLLNGFYEELFFMGLTFAVKPNYRLIAIIASIFIRMAFHSYQGFWSMLAIGFTGLIFILCRKKIQSLMPFMLAHSVFDIFGAGIIAFL